MKRSQQIVRPAMRKRFLLKPLAAVVGTGVLTACGDNGEEVTLIRSVQECLALTDMDIQQCEATYQQAQRESEAAAEKFAGLRDCEEDYGAGNCEQGSGSYFMPMMGGYILAEAVDEAGDAMKKKRRYRTMGVFRNDRENEYYTTTGAPLTATTRYGSYRVNPKAISPTADMMREARKVKPRGASSGRMHLGKARSTSRGGFGSSASRSSWSSSSRSWGG